MVNAYKNVSFSNGEKNEKQGNFIIRELAERAEIREKSKQFKNEIDKQKEKRLYEMELKHKHSMELADNMTGNLEKVLDESNPELIKEMLRNMKF